MTYGYEQRKSFYLKCFKDWYLYANKVLKINLDPEMREAFRAVQKYPYISLASGNARGKDHLAAGVGLTFLSLFKGSKVICTAPTGRQTKSIMMAEMAKIANKAGMTGFDFLSTGIKTVDPEWFLLAFKAQDQAHEAWTGFHSPYIMIIVTEGSGISDNVFENIRKISTGKIVRMLVVFNPNKRSGETFHSATNPRCKFIQMNSLKAPNVIQGKTIYPGQVDRKWIRDKLTLPGWVTKIAREEFNPDSGDFLFEKRYYRPRNIARVGILGMFPTSEPGSLIPYEWFEAAVQRWYEQKEIYSKLELDIGIDVAGEGRNNTVFCMRYGLFVLETRVLPTSGDNYSEDICAEIKRIHDSRHKTDTEQKFKTRFKIDALGLGGGPWQLANNRGYEPARVKVSEGTDSYDATGTRKFKNKRAKYYWKLREMLDPDLSGPKIALPDNDSLRAQLTIIEYKQQGDVIVIEPKDKIIEKLGGESPDEADSVTISIADMTVESELSVRTRRRY